MLNLIIIKVGNSCAASYFVDFFMMHKNRTSFFSSIFCNNSMCPCWVKVFILLLLVLFLFLTDPNFCSWCNYCEWRFIYPPTHLPSEFLEQVQISSSHHQLSDLVAAGEDYQWIMTGVWVCSSHKPVVWLQNTCSKHVIWPIFMVLLQLVWRPQSPRGIIALGKRANWYNISKFVLLCSAEEKYGFGTTQRGINDDRLFLGGWTISLSNVMHSQKYLLAAMSVFSSEAV